MRIGVGVEVELFQVEKGILLHVEVNIIQSF